MKYFKIIENMLARVAAAAVVKVRVAAGLGEAGWAAAARAAGSAAGGGGEGWGARRAGKE